MKLDSLIDSACRLPVVGLLVQAILKSTRDLSKDMAASIAFFSFFSLFPLILGSVAVGSFFLDSAEVKSRLYNLLVNAFPGSSKLVTENIDALIRLRGAAGLTSIVALLWSASKMVGAISRGINNALDLRRDHAFYLSPLRNFGLTIAVVLVFLMIAFSPTVGILAELNLDFLGSRMKTALEIAAGHIASFTFTGILLVALYILIPYERPSWRDLLPGVIVAGLLFELGKKGFLLYVDNVSKLEAIYGSVYSIIVLLLWLYFLAFVLLYGSEIIAVCQVKHEHSEPVKSRTDPQLPV